MFYPIKKRQKYACLLIIFLGLFSSISAQIEQEIMSYQDSSRVIINRGRELVIDKIANYDLEGANKVYLFLQEKALEKQQLAFSSSEIIYINLITGNYSELLDFCKNYQQKSYLKTYSSERSLTQDLYQHFMEQLIDIKNDLEHTQVNAEELALIKLIIYVIEKDSLTGEYSTMLTGFEEENPNTEYTFFVEHFLPSPPLKASFSWDFGPTLISPTGELKKSFNSKVIFGMSFDFNIKKIYTSFYINAGDLRANEAYTIKNTELWVDDRYSYFDGGAKLGYFLCRNEHVHLAPYASISGTTLRTNIYEAEEDNDLELDINKCFSYGLGLHGEVKLFEFTAPYYYGFYGYYGTPNTMITQHFALKFNLGYNIHTQSEYPQFEGNTYYAHIGFVWGFGIF